MSNESPQSDLALPSSVDAQALLWRDNARYPSGFAEFVDVHAEVLPDFKPLAHQALRYAAENPDDLAVIWLDRGTGKTTGFANAVEEVAARQGGRLIGQLSVQPTFPANLSLDAREEQRFYYFDSTKGASSPETIEPRVEFTPYAHSPRELVRSTVATEEALSLDDYLPSQLWQRFSHARAGDVFLIDELEGVAGQYPELVHYVSDLAASYKVPLVASATVLESFYTQDDAEDDISHYIEQQTTTQKNRLIKLAAATTGRKPAIMRPEQPLLVPESAVRQLSRDFDLEPTYIENLLAEPDIRRLRVFEQLVNYLALRNNEPPEDRGPIANEADIRGLFDYSNVSGDKAFGPASRDYTVTQNLDALGQYGLTLPGLQRVSMAITGRRYDR